MNRSRSRWFDNLLVFLLLGCSAGVNVIGVWVNGQLRQAYVQEQEQRYRTESSMLTLRLQIYLQKFGEQAITEAFLQELLQRQHLNAAVGVFRMDGTRLVQAASSNSAQLLEKISVSNPAQEGDFKTKNKSEALPPSPLPVTQLLIDSEGKPWGEVRIAFVLEKASFQEIASRVIYELPVWLVGVLTLYWFGRQMLGVLRVRLQDGESALLSESEEMRLVMDSYQQMINRLQLKGKELERQREEERVRAESSERFSDRLVVSIPSALIVVAGNGQVSVTNVQARELFGSSDFGFRASESKNVMPSYQEFFSGAPEIAELVAEALATGETQRNGEIVAHLGKTRYILEASVSPIPSRTGSWQGVLCLVNDTTEIEALRSGMRLKETLASLGEMAAGIAHEFKNSLATISGYAQLIERGTDAQVAKPAKALRTEVNHLTHMVTDFLSFARPQDLVFSDVNLQELLEDCCERILPEAEKRHITITLSGKFPTLQGDAMLLRRAFLNLLQNAIEAITDEAVQREVTLSCQETTSEGDEIQLFCQIKITDTGAGIPPADLPNVFIPFFTTKSRGYGMGLAIVQKVFVGHNGRVEVESRTGQGTIFTCYLPLKTDH